MRKKIQRSMILVITVTLFFAYAIAIFSVYEEMRSIAEDNLHQEANYITTAVNLAGDEYISSLDNSEITTRVTLINADGTVQYDTEKDASTMENHKNRPEVREALEYGTGQDTRKSDTLGKDMVYYAELLNSGQVLRVSTPVRTAAYITLKLLPVMALIGAGMLLLAYFIAKRASEALVAPINMLNLDHPLDNNDIYEELTPLLKRIDQQNSEKDAIADMRKEFSANVSHELKTPLTSISGYAEIMRDGLAKPEDMPKFSDRIYKEANRLILLVQDIIRLSKLDEGEEQEQMQKTDLYAMAEQVVQRLRPVAARQKVRLMLAGVHCEVQAIPRLLEDMLYNLADNAIKYNKPGGQVMVHVGKAADGPYVVVKDDGIGIPKDQQERVFERFYRVDKSHSKETGGTGLGLSIVKHGAIIHHATIELNSDIGRGTEMTLRFPKESHTI
jgi:two-component system phosphate regulon sensor histidine kinase PhoR